MSLDARAPWWAFSLPRFRGGAAQILSLVLVALVVVFWLLLGDQDERKDLRRAAAEAGQRECPPWSPGVEAHRRPLN